MPMEEWVPGNTFQTADVEHVQGDIYGTQAEAGGKEGEIQAEQVHADTRTQSAQC